MKWARAEMKQLPNNLQGLIIQEKRLEYDILMVRNLMAAKQFVGSGIEFKQ